MSQTNHPRLSLPSSILAGGVLMFAMPVSAQTQIIQPIARYALRTDLKDSVGTSHGTFEGTGGPNRSATFVPDSVFGSVLSFDGVDDRINLGNVRTFQNNSWSVSLWFKTSESSTTALIGKNNGDTKFSAGERVMEITGPNSWSGLGTNVTPGNFAIAGWGMQGVAAKRTVCRTDVGLNDGHWHQILAMHDDTVSNTDLTIYLDGKLASSTTGTFNNNVYPDVGNLYLGFSNYSGDMSVDYLAGQMAEVQFYAGVLTPLNILILHAPFARNLASDTNTLSVGNGGAQALRFTAGPCFGNQNYWFFGSITGTTPGTTIGAVNIPLNVDPYTTLAMGLTNSTVFAMFRGTLDAKGSATARLNVPANQPIPIGTKLFHSCVAFDAGGRILMASNPLQVEFAR